MIPMQHCIPKKIKVDNDFKKTMECNKWNTNGQFNEYNDNS